MPASSRARSLRIAGLTRGPMIALVVDDEPVSAFLGESVATALLASGRRVLRESPRRLMPRGLFCAMGVCQECVLDIDGRMKPACTTPVREGMRIVTKGRGNDR